jgi:plasmid stabilization system protein ParE
VIPVRHRVRLARRAADDIDSAVAYIAEDSPRQAQLWYEGCIEAVRSLELLPKLWPHAAERRLAELGVRSRVYKRYRILFLVRDREVVVVGVRHGAMRAVTLPQFLRRLRG